MEKFDALKALNFGVEDVAKVAECFDIIHHANGRIRLRANANLLKMLANFGANSSALSKTNATNSNASSKTSAANSSTSSATNLSTLNTANLSASNAANSSISSTSSKIKTNAKNSKTSLKLSTNSNNKNSNLNLSVSNSANSSTSKNLSTKNSSVNLNENLGKNSSDLSVANSDKNALERLLSEVENLPFIKSVKINKIIASVTIEYDANAFTPSLWELWLVQKDSEKVFAKVQEMIKAL